MSGDELENSLEPMTYGYIEEIFSKEENKERDWSGFIKDLLSNLREENENKFEKVTNFIFDKALKHNNLKILEFLVSDEETKEIVKEHIGKDYESAINEKNFKLAKIIFQFELDDKYREVLDAKENMTVKLDEKFLKNLKTIAKETYYKAKNKNGKRDSSKDKKDRLDYIENKIKKFKKIREKATNEELETFLNSIYGIFKEIDKPKKEIEIG